MSSFPDRWPVYSGSQISACQSKAPAGKRCEGVISERNKGFLSMEPGYPVTPVVMFSRHVMRFHVSYCQGDEQCGRRVTALHRRPAKTPLVVGLWAEAKRRGSHTSLSLPAHGGRGAAGFTQPPKNRKRMHVHNSSSCKARTSMSALGLNVDVW